MGIFFMVVAALVLLLVGAIFGAWLIDGYWQERSRQEAHDAQLTALWRAMHAANRIEVAFWVARQAMQDEADRHEGER